MKSEYKKDAQRKRCKRALADKFPEMKRTVSNNLPKQHVRIDNKTIVLAPAAASTLAIRSRYASSN